MQTFYKWVKHELIRWSDDEQIYKKKIKDFH